MPEWKPITDLSSADRAAANPELGPLLDVWLEQRQRLEESGLLGSFIQRLVREWSVETGILERLYTIDRGVTQLLIEQGFDAALIPHGTTDRSADEVVAVLRDHEQSADLVFDVVRQDRPLTVGLIKELHALITRHQNHVEGLDQFGNTVYSELRRGEFKAQPNNPTRPDGEIHPYCPPMHVQSEMDRLVELHGQHIAEDLPADVAAAWLHHRFAQIHPFADGNGRVARAITNIVFIRAGWFPLVVRNDDRTSYLDALEAADDGDLAPLVRLFGEIQRRAFVQALGLSEAVRREDTSLDDLLDAIDEELGQSAAERETSYAEVFPLADSLLDIAIERLDTIERRLEPQMSGHADRRVYSTHRRHGEEGSDWNRFTLVQVAKQFGYYANFDTFASWTRLRIQTEAGLWEIVIGMHGIGTAWRGVVAGSMLISRIVKEEDQPVRNVDVLRSVDEVFQLNYLDDAEQARDRFRRWLDRGLQTALQQWRIAMSSARGSS